MNDNYMIIRRHRAIQWISELPNPATRQEAIAGLSRMRDAIPDLPHLLWNSFGARAALLFETTNMYKPFMNKTLTREDSSRYSNVLALYQALASDPRTRVAFLQDNIQHFIFPFLDPPCEEEPYDCLRLTTLGVFGAVLKSDEPNAVICLLQTEIIPKCLKLMEADNNKELTKVVATFILEKILLQETGLNYICESYVRFTHVSEALQRVVMFLLFNPDSRLLKHVVQCYFRLSCNSRGREALKLILPMAMKDNTFLAIYKDDSQIQHWLGLLLDNVK